MFRWVRKVYERPKTDEKEENQYPEWFSKLCEKSGKTKSGISRQQENLSGTVDSGVAELERIIIGTRNDGRFLIQKRHSEVSTVRSATQSIVAYLASISDEHSIQFIS